MVAAFAASNVLGELGLGEQLTPYLDSLSGVPPLVTAMVVGLVVVIVAGPLNTTSTLAAIGPVAFVTLTAAGIPPHIAIAAGNGPLMETFGTTVTGGVCVVAGLAGVSSFLLLYTKQGKQAGEGDHGSDAT